jgi:hypothetical protein
MKPAQLQWLLIGLAALVLVGYLWYAATTTAATHEGFTTVDLPTATAQRQLLQMEGERRYNPVARLQAPGQKVAASDLDAAITTARAVPTNSHTAASLLGLVGSSLGLGAADDGTNKSGEWVEQTGTVQDKINFCESLTTIDCARLENDPRLRECGFCHRDGKNSKGKGHRGGLYISSDDQIRANEAAEGGHATYKPTIGTCAPQNFTLMTANCKARETQLQCQSAGAPTTGNPCAQCYGKTPGNATGLIYFNPNKPYRHQVFFYPSHTGHYTGPNGYGLEVRYSNGAIVGLPASSRASVSPPSQPLGITLAEGDTIQITIYGPPTIFCGWFSNQKGNRTVSLDVGMQSMSPEGAFEIAGDKHSQMVTRNIVGDGSIGEFMNTVPNTVLWYMRRNDKMFYSILRALYGNPGTPSPDVTATIQQMLASNKAITVGPSLLGDQADPAPGTSRNLLLTYDVLAASTNFADGQVINTAALNTKVTFTFQMPATLADPPLEEDLADCPSGPLVTTEVGAGLMGAHSCFKPDGTFNPTAYCLQELFQSAGGTKAGTAWPGTDAAAAALVAKSGTLDDTVAILNNLGSIANYGTDMNGNMVEFETYKEAAMRMLGIAVNNPCDGPTKETGPHSPECLDYLWRTMNNAAQDGTPMTTQPPFSGCSAHGLMAPLDAGGKPNQSNIAKANSHGSASSVRAFYEGIYNTSQNSNDFSNQVAAMRDCYGTNIQPPVTPPDQCPTPAANEWRCINSDLVQQPEVFAVCPDGDYTVAPENAEGVCNSYGARLAAPEEVAAAQRDGAQWCNCAWVNTPGQITAQYPMQKGQQGCGGPGINNCGTMHAGWEWNPGKACVTCYGKKPKQGTKDVRPFSSVPGGPAPTWNDPSAVWLSKGFAAMNGLFACRWAQGQVQCTTTDGTYPTLYPDQATCDNFVKTPESKTENTPIMNLASQNQPLATLLMNTIRNTTN